MVALEKKVGVENKDHASAPERTKSLITHGTDSVFMGYMYSQVCTIFYHALRLTKKSKGKLNFAQKNPLVFIPHMTVCETEVQTI